MRFAQRSSSPTSQSIRNSSSERAPLFRNFVLFGMGALLIILAVLQYRWNAALTATTQAQMGARLELLLIRWQVDFYDEISAICVALQVGPDSGARDSWKDYLQRYAEWSRGAVKQDAAESVYTRRDLVKGIYIWETSQSAKPRLLRLDAENKTIENSDVPEGLTLSADPSAN